MHFETISILKLYKYLITEWTLNMDLQQFHFIQWTNFCHFIKGDVHLRILWKTLLNFAIRFTIMLKMCFLEWARLSPPPTDANREYQLFFTPLHQICIVDAHPSQTLCQNFHQTFHRRLRVSFHNNNLLKMGTFFLCTLSKTSSLGDVTL